MAHWSESYIGRPYVPESADCAILYYTVSREVFGKDVPDIAAIKRAASRLGRMTQMADAVAAYALNEVTINWNAPLVWVATYVDMAGRRP